MNRMTQRASALLTAASLLVPGAVIGHGCGGDPEAKYCGLGTTGDSGGVDGPWLELYHRGAEVTDGAELNVTCGGQGAAMVQVDPVMGGFDPGGDNAFLDVQFSVQGFNFGFGGFFYSNPEQPIYVACREDDSGYDGGGLPDDALLMLLPDDVSGNPSVLDGELGELRVVLDADGQPVEKIVSVTLRAPEGFVCGYGYP